jgi:50S ribosomal protein L16 3-hydroxylase
MIAQPMDNAPMDVDEPLALLGGLSPAAFMRRHWQRRPLLVRGAMPGVEPPLARAALFDMAGRDDVESRLVERDGRRWSVRAGPLPRRATPPLRRPRWTLLVQGLDLHVPAAHALLSRFRFVPDARLDDLMVSWASDGGGVGPHVDSYDVFLLQVHGRRRWRVGPLADRSLVPGLPLKILRRFEPTHDWLLEPGDMLYLPPGWGHDGVAQGECMTCSIGFRAPSAAEVAHDVLQRAADAIETEGSALYRDSGQPATDHPAEVPAALQDFARAAVQRALLQPQLLERALGEALTEPKPRVWFEAGTSPTHEQGIALDRRTRMMYDARHVFINGEAFRAGGRDATLMRRLADERRLAAAALARLSPPARELVDEWARAGWLHAE